MSFNPFDTSRGDAEAARNELYDLERRAQELEQLNAAKAEELQRLQAQTLAAIADLRREVDAWRLVAAQVSVQTPGADISTPANFRTAQLLGLSRILADADRLRAALRRIVAYPVHSEPVGGAMAMQDIAQEALAPKLPPWTPTSNGHFVGCPPDCHAEHPGWPNPSRG